MKEGYIGKVDSKGFRILTDQVPDFSHMEDVTITKILRDSVIYDRGEILTILVIIIIIIIIIIRLIIIMIIIIIIIIIIMMMMNIMILKTRRKINLKSHVDINNIC